MSGVLPPSTLFLESTNFVLGKFPEKEITNVSSVVEVIKSIVNGSLPQNECFPHTICNNIIAKAVEILNSVHGPGTYRFEMKPKVQVNADSRNDKESDISLIRVRNSRTFVLIEVKLSVPLVLSADEKLLNDFSQLILEAILMSEKDKDTIVYNELLLILTDGTVWHLFHVDLSGWTQNEEPVSFLKYDTLSDRNIPVLNIIRIILGTIPILK